MIGIIQGRLGEPIDGKFQSFPWGRWEEEFKIAKEIGIDCIGWIFEQDRYTKNPLWTEVGRQKLLEIINETQVNIEYLCADYFMENPFIRVSKEKYQETYKMLEDVMERTAKLKIKGIELPMVDNSRIDTDEELDSIIITLRGFIPLMEKYNLELSIESSLPPTKLKYLMEKLDHPLFCITYDSGNSSSMGYDTTEEIETFGKWIHNFHVKDRLLHGTTVPLGTGDANFDQTFSALKKIGYTGLFTLQAARADDQIENTKNQLKFLHSYIDKYLNS